MKPVNQQRKSQLEREVGFVVCPLTVERTFTRSFLAGEDGRNLYKCAKDHSPARGGLLADKTIALAPCSMSFAEKCPIYQAYGHLLPIVYPELGYKPGLPTEKTD